jgi:uridylate kinase
VDALYDRDPKLPGARPLSALTWVQFGRLFTDKHRPGANVPFDPVAARRSRTSRMTVAFVGADLPNLAKVFNDQPFQGTVVTP